MQENENINEEPVEETTGETTGQDETTEAVSADAVEVSASSGDEAAAVSEEAVSEEGESETAAPAAAALKHRRQEKVGLVTSDKMQKTVVVRVERQVQHPKYRRYIRRRSKFMAHNELGAQVGDMVRIVETRPLSARKRWRVAEIVQKAR